MTITIQSAAQARGYSGFDHLLDDGPLQAMVGRTYKNIEAAARAAGRLLKGTQDRRCAGSPVILTDAEGNGWRRWTDGSTVA